MLSKIHAGCRARFGTIIAGLLGLLAYALIGLIGHGCGGTVPLPMPPRPEVVGPLRATAEVKVVCPEGTGMASAGAVGPAQLLTARHVVVCDNEAKPTSLEVRPLGSLRWYPATVLWTGSSPAEDVALVALPEPAFDTWLPVGVSPGPLERVCRYSPYPAPPEVACGEAVPVPPNYLRFRGEAETREGHYAHNARGIPGHSGSPILDAGGRIVGIHVGSTYGNASGFFYGASTWAAWVARPEP